MSETERRQRVRLLNYNNTVHSPMRVHYYIAVQSVRHLKDAAFDTCVLDLFLKIYYIVQELGNTGFQPSISS